MKYRLKDIKITVQISRTFLIKRLIRTPAVLRIHFNQLEMLLKRGRSLTCLQKLNFIPIDVCFPHLRRGLLFSARRSIVLRDACSDIDFRGVNKNVERI